MSASNEAAGVKCWRLPNVCVRVCVKALCMPRACARRSFAAKKCPSLLECMCVGWLPPPLPPPCHWRFVDSALMWPVAKTARRLPTPLHLNLTSLFPQQVGYPVCPLPPFIHTHFYVMDFVPLLYDWCSFQLADKEKPGRISQPDWTAEL